MAAPSAKLLAALRESFVPMVDIDPKLKALIYGESGAGKTVEALELARIVNPPDKKILYLDTGEGWVSLQNHPQLMNNVTRMVYLGLAQIEALVDAIAANVPGFENFSTLIFDEFSTVAKKDIHNIVKATLGDGEYESAEFKQYNIATRRMERVAWKLLELKESHHLILIAHEKYEENKITGITVTQPVFMNKFGGTLRGEMHIVARQTADVTNKEGAPVYKREMQVHPSKMIIAKSRIGGLDIKVSPEKFNARMVQWIAEGGKEVDEKEVVELASEKQIQGDFSDQTEFTQTEFTGFELEN